MRPWEKLYVELDRAASRLGYSAPYQLGSGNSQCFGFKYARRPVVLFGFRDLARDPAKYKAEDHLWVEGFGPILREYVRLITEDEEQELPISYGIVIDNMENRFVVVPLRLLLATYELRSELRFEKLRNLTFGLIRGPGHGYTLQTPAGAANIVLEKVDTLQPILDALKEAKQTD